ncbi:unnamed protein product, partial [Amoebophrya sp. A25]|eukprot:GSA25T00012934001.1
MRCTSWEGVRQVPRVHAADETSDTIRRSRIFTGYCLSSCEKDPNCAFSLVHAPGGGSSTPEAVPATPYICRLGRYAPIVVTPGPSTEIDKQEQRKATESLISLRLAYGVPHGRPAGSTAGPAQSPNGEQRAALAAAGNQEGFRFSLYTKADPDQSKEALEGRWGIVKALDMAPSLSIDESLFEWDRLKLSRLHDHAIALWRMVLANEQHSDYLLALLKKWNKADDDNITGDKSAGASFYASGDGVGASLLLPISEEDNSREDSELDRKVKVETNQIRPHNLEGQQVLAWLTEQGEYA